MALRGVGRQATPPATDIQKTHPRFHFIQLSPSVMEPTAANRRENGLF
jgi:hypothetical protein